MVMNPRMARMMMTTTAPLTSGSGSLSGIAAQVSFPSMSTSGLTWRARLSGTRHRLIDDAFEQLRLDRTIGRGWHGLARLCQFGVAGCVEGGPGAEHLRKPGIEIAGGHRLHDEPHPGKAVAAEICRKAGKLARL